MIAGHSAITLQHLSDFAVRLARKPVALPSRPLVTEAAEALGADAEMLEIPPVMLDAVAVGLRAGATAGQWDLLTARDWRYAPWALWTGQPAPASFSSVIDALRSRAQSARGSARARTLVASYLQNYRPDRPGLRACAEAVRDALAAHASRDNRARQWLERDRTAKLFDAEKGPTEVARNMLDTTLAPEMVLRGLGLDHSQLQLGGFVHAVHDEVLGRLGRALPTPVGEAVLARLRTLIELPSGQLRFPGSAALLGRCLLRPWLDGRTVPADTLRQTITDMLLKHLGDPRATGAVRWQAVPPDCVELFRRWVARTSLEEFFDVISDQTDATQWRQRRAFWLSVMDAGVIEDAWVVLNSAGLRTARRRLGQLIGCGQLRGYAADQSVVLLRIRNLICAEVSHNGSLRIWRNDWRNAPQLGRAEYLRDELSGAGLDFPDTDTKGRLAHMGGERFRWQLKAAELLRRQTGIRLDQSQW